MNTEHEIREIKKQWGNRLIILGHYYQRDEVVRHADVLGDSLELARKAAAAHAAERIVFCGVHFMAESADILAGPHQSVYMPDVHATCPMAEMAALSQVQRAWERLQAVGADWIPVVYVNSTAEIKAFCGEHNGSACTSSNAAKVFEWVFAQHKRVFFLPDEHLGYNTAHDLGLSDSSVAVLDPDKDQCGLSDDQVLQARIVVWKGYCHVHTLFSTADVEWIRRTYPHVKIIVHPETPKDVLRLCDAHGSTSHIIRYVESLPKDSVVAIGTEHHLVQRLAHQHQGRLTVIPLSVSSCPNMALTDEAKLLDLLKRWPEQNIVRVPDSLKPKARKALSTMLSIS